MFLKATPVRPPHPGAYNDMKREGVGGSIIILLLLPYIGVCMISLGGGGGGVDYFLTFRVFVFEEGINKLYWALIWPF